MKLPLEIQLALGGGYLGYCVAYAGLRRGHSSTDAAMISLVFGLFAVGAFRVLSWLPFWLVWVQLAAGVALAVAAGAAWRKWGPRAVGKLQERWDIHQDDGLRYAWDSLVQEQGLKVSQVRVLTRDGADLFCQNRSAYEDAAGTGLILGGDGGIVMVVDTEERDGREELRSNVVDRFYGTRLTYIPPESIARVELRCVLPTSSEAVTPDEAVPAVPPA
ncbi:MAG: hypothetical protein BWX69_03138 [Planctomycetes bacterium ADurb.Bin069]|nr:MAG: hypothetical protein BWX69_03138 [Planctomycetes bacterium ADurb.Bin069]